MISVHRGLWSVAPENSLAAIAAARVYDIIEIDTQVARDGVPVVLHDPDLTRTARSPLRPRDTDHATLVAQALLHGAGGPEAGLTNQRLPTLSQALDAAGPKAFFDIDVKYPEEVEAVASYLARRSQPTCGTLKIDANTPAEIDRLLSLQQRSGIAVMAKVTLPQAGTDQIRALKNAGVVAVEVWFDDLEMLGAACAIAGDAMAVSTYTLDPVHCCGLSDSRARSDPDRVWGKLLEAGVTIIMTDLAPELDAYLGRENGGPAYR